jgi:hypothetical protein
MRREYLPDACEEAGGAINLHAPDHATMHAPGGKMPL